MSAPGNKVATTRQIRSPGLGVLLSDIKTRCFELSQDHPNGGFATGASPGFAISLQTSAETYSTNALLPRPWGLVQPIDARARTDATVGEPALFHLQRIQRQSARRVRHVGLRSHVLDVDDAAVAADEGDRQRHVGV